MANYGAWITPSQLSGSGEADVNFTGQQNTGRGQRSTQVRFTAANCEDVLRTITQQGKPESVDIDDTASVSQAGQTLTISGVSNSKKLTFSKANDGIGLTIPSTYTAAGASATNGTNIPNDPGAAADYNFSIVFANVGANPGITARTCQLIVTDEGGHTDTCLITQAAGAAYLTVTPASLEMDWEGHAVTAHVSSNTSWSIS